MVNIDGLKIHFQMGKEPRDKQMEALEFMKKSINRGYKYMMMNLPTGAGKSYLVFMFANWYRNFVNENANFDVLTNSKLLQDQYVSDYPFMTNFKGRSNYACDPHDTNCATGYEICSVIGPKCGKECPYEAAKLNWISADISLTNFHLFNTCALFAKNIINRRESTVLIIDEAHEMEPVFTGYISLMFNAKTLKMLGFTADKTGDIDKKIGKIQTISSFSDLVDELQPAIEQNKEKFEAKLKSASTKMAQEYSRYIETCDSYLQKMLFFKAEYEADSSNWTLDVSRNPKDKFMSGVSLEAKPVWGHKYMLDSLYARYDHVVFMSATIDNEVFPFINGIDPKKATYFETDSPFKVENRPIYFLKAGKMSYATKEETLKKEAVIIKQILDKYAGKKGIIHCSSYDVSKFIADNIHDDRFLFHTSDNRDEMLQKHLSSSKPTVLVSVNMESGIDLKDDHSRFQVICKVPYPFLGSQNIKTRQSEMPDWYTVETVNKLVQACGRSVRNNDDYADTYILDSNFSDLLKYGSKFFPHWLLESIQHISKV